MTEDQTANAAAKQFMGSEYWRLVEMSMNLTARVAVLERQLAEKDAELSRVALREND